MVSVSYSIDFFCEIRFLNDVLANMTSACDIKFVSTVLQTEISSYPGSCQYSTLRHLHTTQELSAHFRLHTANSALLPGIRVPVQKNCLIYGHVVHYILTRKHHLGKCAKDKWPLPHEPILALTTAAESNPDSKGARPWPQHQLSLQLLWRQCCSSLQHCLHRYCNT